MLFSIWVAGDPHINLCVGQSDIARKRKDGKCVDGVRKWLGQWGRNSKGGAAVYSTWEDGSIEI